MCFRLNSSEDCIYLHRMVASFLLAAIKPFGVPSDMHRRSHPVVIDFRYSGKANTVSLYNLFLESLKKLGDVA